jgi:aminoglycoside phosphotransferase (APT) family kinase protein
VTDWERLDTWLAGRGMHRDGPEPTKFTGGLANLNYLIHVDGTPMVLRRPPGGELAEGASDMAREHRVLSRLHEHYPLAPSALAFCDDPGVLGAPFQLIEYRAGVTITDTVPDGMAPLDGFVEALAGLHAIDVDAAGLGELGRPDGFLRRQVDGWERRAHAAFGDGTPPSVDAIVTWLRENQPESGHISLLHNDFKFDNVIFDPATSEVRAVIDWDMSTLGDPLFDLGVTLSYWAEPGDPPALRDLGQSPSLAAGSPDRRGLAAAYFAAAGLDPVPVDFHVVLARFRLAVAWQQMYVLHERGALAGPRYATFNALATEILEWTADTQRNQ